jgi:hypothetical protein
VSKELITSLQAEYMQLDREVRKLSDELGRKKAKLERVVTLLNQEQRARVIHEAQFNRVKAG